MTWRRPGDKVLPLEERLMNLERRSNLLLFSNLVLIGLHLQEFGPATSLIGKIAGAVGHLGGLV
jgi:hypothetical protein